VGLASPWALRRGLARGAASAFTSVCNWHRGPVEAFHAPLRKRSRQSRAACPPSLTTSLTSSTDSKRSCEKGAANQREHLPEEHPQRVQVGKGVGGPRSAAAAKELRGPPERRALPTPARLHKVRAGPHSLRESEGCARGEQQGLFWGPPTPVPREQSQSLQS